MKRKRHKNIRKKARNNNKAKIVCDDNCDISNVIEWTSLVSIYNHRKYINILYKHMKYGNKMCIG